MKVLNVQDFNKELPFQVQLSFGKIFEFLEEKSTSTSDSFGIEAKETLTELEKHPILRDGFSDMTLINTYQVQINKILDLLFPELLLTNEIKAVSVPFSFTTFKFSTRFEKILEDAGSDYEFNIRNFEDDKIYIMACSFIISYYYKYNLDFKRPFLYDIPNKKTGQMKHYRAAFNGDFFEVSKTNEAPKVTEEDIISLLDNFDNIEKWKEIFPPNSYRIKGFGLVNLFDVTSDEIISRLKASLLKEEANIFIEIQKELAALFDIPNLHFGFSIYDPLENKLKLIASDHNKSVVIPEHLETMCEGYFCDNIITKVFKNHQIMAISDTEKYGITTGKNNFYKSLKKHKIGSILLLPLVAKGKVLGLMELGAKNKHELNSIIANKLKDVIPVFTIAAERKQEERENRLDAIIQENYTSIHPSVKWRFLQAADKHLSEITAAQTTEKNLDTIVFENVFPLYGQCDIKGSSTARNKAIQEDLILQLEAVVSIIQKTLNFEKLPVYKELIFRTKNFIQSIVKGLKTGDEETVTQFLINEITPVFEHIKTVNNSLTQMVDAYTTEINPQLNIVYKKRKEYEAYVTTLNNTLANYIDEQQEEAQKMFPHYFERYKTDGVDFNMYIGQSLVKDKTYHTIYLQNLRLWQLKLICELENKVYKLQKQNSYSLDIASLILVHSNPLAITFRMDEKQFDVDGAYNIRYEIIKKRIDKSHIKNTNERITQPHKIAIIYTHDSDRIEYLKYIHFLQSKGYLKSRIEELEVEDLQGISGLKALRVSLNYSKDSEKISFEDLMQVVKSDSY